MKLSQISGVIMDMDGVLWRGDEPLPGLVPLFEMLRDYHMPFVLATNNSRKAPVEYVEKLAGMGVMEVRANQVITSGTATASFLRTIYPRGTRIYVIGGDGLVAVLTEAGFVVTDYEVAAVVVGIDFDLTYDKLRRATLLIRNGARFIGTNPDVTFPTPFGLAPGAGSILSALVTATDIQPTVIGKPDLPMFEEALRLLQLPAPSVLMIGDRLETDIAGAKAAGLCTAMVLTGVSTSESLASSGLQPDWVFDGLPELIAAWDSD